MTDIKSIIKEHNDSLGITWKKYSKDKRISISQIKDSLAVEFDQEGVAKKTYNNNFNNPDSIYYQKTVEEIIEMWTSKADKSKQMGNLVDNFVGFEYDLWDNPNDQRILNEVAEAVKVADPIVARKYNGVHRAIEEFRKNGYVFEAREMPLYLEYPYKKKIWLINGRFDAIFSNGDLLVIVDWKNNEEVKDKNPWQKMLGPMKKYDDCDLIKFTIQVYMYMYILKEEYKVTAPISSCIVQFPGQKDFFYRIFMPAFDYDHELMKKIIEYSIDSRIEKEKQLKKMKKESS